MVYKIKKTFVLLLVLPFLGMSQSITYLEDLGISENIDNYFIIQRAINGNSFYLSTHDEGNFYPISKSIIIDSRFSNSVLDMTNNFIVPTSDFVGNNLVKIQNTNGLSNITIKNLNLDGLLNIHDSIIALENDASVNQFNYTSKQIALFKSYPKRFNGLSLYTDGYQYSVNNISIENLVARNLAKSGIIDYLGGNTHYGNIIVSDILRHAIGTTATNSKIRNLFYSTNITIDNIYANYAGTAFDFSNTDKSAGYVGAIVIGNVFANKLLMRTKLHGVYNVTIDTYTYSNIFNKSIYPALTFGDEISNSSVSIQNMSISNLLTYKTVNKFYGGKTAFRIKNNNTIYVKNLRVHNVGYVSYGNFKAGNVIITGDRVLVYIGGVAPLINNLIK